MGWVDIMVGTSFWYLFGTYLILFGTFWVPGRMDRVSGEKLKISVHLDWVLSATIEMAFFLEIVCSLQVYLCN